MNADTTQSRNDHAQYACAPSGRGMLPCGAVVALLRLCRLYYALPMSFILGLTIVYAHDGDMGDRWTATLAASCALALVIAGAYVFNDVCDRRADCINAPRRPVAAGHVLAGVACMWAVFLFIAGFVVATVYCRPLFAVLLVTIAAGLVVYDLVSKRLSLGKQLLVATLVTSIYPLALAQTAFSSSSRARTLLFFPAWLFLTSFGYEILKDIRDARGDGCAGHVTWIGRHPHTARHVASASVIAGALILIVPAFVGCRSLYLMCLPLPIAAGVISTLLPIRPAMAAIYIECVLVGISTTADLAFM